MKTIKQIADELGVSKQTVRDIIAKLSLQSSLRKNGNSFAIDGRQEALIRQEYYGETKIKSQSETQTTLQNDLHFALRLLETQNEQLGKELEIKNEQIKELNSRLAESNIALVAAQQSAQAAQALHAGTIQKSLTDGGADPPLGFFARFFKRGK